MALESKASVATKASVSNPDHASGHIPMSCVVVLLRLQTADRILYNGSNGYAKVHFMMPQTGISPVKLEDYPSTDTTPDELVALQTLQQAGITVAPIIIVPPIVEEQFYRLNNLPAQLAELFASVDPKDPDEDDVEDAAPEALTLLKSHYLLDETIDLFYSVLAGQPGRVQVRRCGSSGYSATRGRPALMKVKQLWTDDWTFKAVMARLTATQLLGLEAHPVLIHPAGDAPSLTLSEDASRVLKTSTLALGNAGQKHVPTVEVWAHAEYGVTRVLLIN